MSVRRVEFSEVGGVIGCQCGCEDYWHSDEHGNERRYGPDGEVIQTHLKCEKCGGICHTDDVRVFDPMEWGGAA